MSANTGEKLSSKNLWGYALGAIPTGLMSFVFTFKYIEFFFDTLKIEPILFIWGQVIYLVINAINDPLLGQLSDNTNRERWGSRRLIYIKYGGPIWALSFILIWFPWSFDNQIIIFIHYTLSICLFDTLFTLIVLVWMALLPEMTSDTDERNKANFLSLILGTLGVAPFFILLGEIDLLSNEFRVIIIIMAIISTGSLFFVSIFCKEKEKLEVTERFPLWTSIKETIKLRSFQVFVAYNFCNVFLINLGLSYLFIYTLVLGEGIGTGMAIVFFIIIYLIIGYGSQFFCTKLRPKWGMRKVILRFGTLRVLGTSILFALSIIPSLEWMIWIGFIWSTFFGGYSVYTTGGLMYISVDEDEINHGYRREGMFLGMNALFTKPAASIAPIMATLVLVSFGYVQGSDIQTPLALLGIKILFLLIPTIVTAIGLMVFYFYPYHGKSLEGLRERLKEVQEKTRLK